MFDSALTADCNHYMCVYRLISPSGKSYIGQARDFDDRQSHRKYEYSNWLKNIENGMQCKGENPKLFLAFKKYGIENFKVEILEENIESPCKLNEIEEYYIDLFDCVSKGYNICAGGGVYINPETGRSYNYGQSKYEHNRTDETVEYQSEWYFANHEENLAKRNQYRLANQDKIIILREKNRVKDNDRRRKLNDFMRESNVSMFGEKRESFGKCFRNWFGGGRTRSYNFIRPKGITNEQGCWLYW